MPYITKYVDVNTEAEVEVEIDAEEWFEQATDSEKDEMAKLLDRELIDRDVLRALIKHLENNQLEGVSEYKQRQFLINLQTF